MLCFINNQRTEVTAIFPHFSGLIILICNSKFIKMRRFYFIVAVNITAYEIDTAGDGCGAEARP